MYLTKKSVFLNLTMKKAFLVLSLLGVVGFCFAQNVPAGLEYEIVNGKSVTITGYTGNASSLVIPDRIGGLPVTVIGHTAFWGRGSLTSVTIPESVNSIGNGAFWGCTSLTSIAVDSRNSAYASVEGVLFDKNIRTLIQYPIAKSGTTYIVPSSVASIGNEAFAGCGSLTSVTIPESVNSIGTGAFSGCKSLASIAVDSKNPAYVSVDGVLFDKNIRTLIQYPSAKSGTTYIVPSSVNSIGIAAFAGTSLTSVTIPESVNSIGNAAFSGCTSLTSVTIPQGVASIGDSAFFGCSSLASVTLSRRTQLGEYAFSSNTRIVYSD